MLKSSAYVLINLAIVAALFYAATFIQYFPKSVAFLLWAGWWWLQGVAMTGKLKYLK